jgi:uncharacterized protein DUF4145
MKEGKTTGRDASRAAFSALRALSKEAPGNWSILENFEALQRASDRSLAIVAAAMVEDALESLLTEGWHRRRGRDLRGHKLTGPTGTFAQKTKDCFALGLIGPKTRDRLDSIREIRNAFAHASLHITFRTQEVIDVCRLLRETRSKSPRRLYWDATWDLCWGFHCWGGVEDRMNASPDPEDRDRNPIFP